MIGIDLFAGAGGATVGLTSAGVRVILAVECDKYAASTYRQNHPSTSVLASDIRTLDPVQAVHELGFPADSVDVLNSCPPCQGFSTLHRGELDVARNQLVLETHRWAAALRPRFVLLENVPGLKKQPEYSELVQRLRAEGYAVRDWVLDAYDLGAPQHRKRLFLFAELGGDAKAMPRDLPGALPPNWHFERSAATVIARAESLDPAIDTHHVHRKLTPRAAERIAALPANGNRFDLPAHLQLSCHKRLSARQATASYSRVPTEGPSRTLTTRCTTPACGAFAHPRLPRGITLREAALLQTFPIDYRFAGQYDRIERQIGNAVPPRMTQAVFTVLSKVAS